MELLPFVKIFETSGGQFLVRKAYNVDEEKFEIVMSVSVKDGPDINFTLSFLNLQNRDRQYDDFNEEMAEQFVAKFESHFQEFPAEEPTIDMISREEPIVQQRPLIILAGDEEYQQIAETLGGQQQPPSSIILP